MKDYIKNFMKAIDKERKELEREYNKELRDAAKQIFNLEMALVDAGYSKDEARKLVIELIFTNKK